MHRKYKWGVFFIAAVFTIFTWAIPLQTVSAEKDSERFVDTQNDSNELDAVEMPTQALLSLKDSEDDEGTEEDQSDDAEELDSQEVYITDDVLAEPVTEELGKEAGQPITEADMEQLVELEKQGAVGAASIRSLGGLQSAKNLERLHLPMHDLNDISPLSNLGNLQSLDLAYSSVNDLAPLSNLGNVESLNLFGNPINDVAPLANLEKLRDLDLAYTFIEDISSLSDLPNLENLNLDGNPAQDDGGDSQDDGDDVVNGSESDEEGAEEESGEFGIDSREVYFEDAVLEKAIAEELGIDGRAITEADMTKLPNLYANGYDSERITSLEGLQYATNLVDLSLWDNDISDLTPISGLENLSYLDLDDNNIEDLTPLANLKNLMTLYLDNNAIEDITPLQELTLADMYISLYGNHIDDEAAIQYLRDNGASVGYYNDTDSPEVYFEDEVLEEAVANTLGIEGRAITESDMAKLTDLYANDYDSDFGPITSLEGLQYAENLMTLDLMGNNISDLTPLSGLKNLESLTLWDNAISDLTPLSSLENLSYLDLDENYIEDLAPLTNLTSLETLYLSYNEIEDITPLQELSLMDMYISLYGNYFDDEETIQYLRDNGATINYDWEEESPEVYFEDGVLEAAIAEELGVEGRPITEEDMAKLTELTAYGTDSESITSLEGLQYAENLRELKLISNGISDLTPLSNLVNLEELTLWDNDVSDITPLENLRNLSYLDLDNNAIEDLTPLSDLKNLETLHLDDNAINDITPLKELSLKDMYISLYGNNFNDDDTIQYLRDNGAIVGYYSTEGDEEDETETPDPDDDYIDPEGKGNTPNSEGSGDENGETNGDTPAPEDNEGGNEEQENNTPVPEGDDGENEGAEEETPNPEENEEGTGNSENETPTPVENEEGTGNPEDATPTPTEAEGGNGEANNAAPNAVGTTGGSGESGNNSTAEESQSDVRGETTAEKLPNTSTNAYNWFLAGAIFLFAGSYMLIFYAYRNRINNG